MTWALCMNCGSLKFGALCPCPQCQVASTGDEGLDILFSTHCWRRKTLEELGAVVQAIQTVSGDRMLGFWAFIQHVSDKYPEILHADLKPEVHSRVDAILAGLVLPSVMLRRAPGTARCRPWWRFW
jgi:hypothetical protein